RTPSPASHRGRLLPPLAAARLRFSPLSCPFARPSVIVGEPSGESSSGGAIMKRLGVFILLFFSAAGVHAQDPAAIAAVRDADLPPDVRARLEAIVADPGTVVFRGTTRIRAGEEVARPVVVQGGALVVAGVARGPVAVIRGALEIEPGGIVEGGVFLIDRSCAAADTARVGGAVTGEGDVARIPSLRIRPAAPGSPPKATCGVSGVALGSGLARARVGAAYDRIRGMAVRVGPELTFPSGES